MVSSPISTAQACHFREPAEVIDQAPDVPLDAAIEAVAVRVKRPPWPKNAVREQVLTSCAHGSSGDAVTIDERRELIARTLQGLRALAET